MQTQLFIGGRFVPAAKRRNARLPQPARQLGDRRSRRWPDPPMSTAPWRRRKRRFRSGATWRRWSGAACCSNSPMQSKRTPMSWRGSNRSIPATRFATHAISMCRAPRRTFRYFGGMADKFEGSVIPVEAGFLNYVTREPVGVVGQVVPWNFPLMFTSWKMAPALAAGNCVIMKPAELTPLSSLAIAELMAEVGFPDGRRQYSCRAWVMWPGSTLPSIRRSARSPSPVRPPSGRKIVQASSGNLKKVQLELGGKGANIVFGDANIDAVVQGSAFGIFHNQGQACIAGSRMIVHESIADEVLEKFIALSRTIRIGNPLDPAHRNGTAHLAPASRPRAVVMSTLRVSRAVVCWQAARRRTMPRWRTAATSSRPLSKRNRSDRVSQEEVFGPFMTVTHIPHRRRGARNCQRHRVRSRRGSVDARPAARTPGGSRDCAPAWCGSTAISA